MCLTIPKKILSSKKGLFEVKSPRGKELLSSIIKIKKGDWVLTQNGIIIRKITNRQASEINKLLK